MPNLGFSASLHTFLHLEHLPQSLTLHLSPFRYLRFQIQSYWDSIGVGFLVLG